MKLFTVHFYHGYDDVLAERLSKICLSKNTTENGRTFFVYEGSLDDFHETFSDINIGIRNDLIYITKYASWGAR